MASMSVGLLGILLALALAYMYRRHTDYLQQKRLFNVLSGLIRAEEKASLSNVRIAIGFGGCRDVIVNASELFDKLNASLPQNPYHVDTVKSKNDLENLVAYFFPHGAAVERYVTDKQFFEEVKRALNEIPSSRKRQHVAGAAPTMAKRLAAEGAEILLGARFTGESLLEIPPEIAVVGRKLEEDDLHVIMEYKVNEVMGPHTAPRDNRAIIHSDSSSPYLDSIEEFASKIESFKPSLLIIGGLQMMDNFPFKTGERIARLAKLRDLLVSLPMSTKIHVEMASFTEQKLLEDLIEYVIPYVDSMGMNEQELPNIVTVSSGGNVTYVSDSKPRIAVVLDSMRKLYSTVARLRRGPRRFTRLHVHTLAYQAILTDTAGAAWKQTMSATARSSLVAHRYTCNVDAVDTTKAKIIMDDSFLTSLQQRARRIQFDSDRPVSCWKEANVEICVAPVLVCTQVHKTAGAGDNISSSGIMLQI